MATDTVSNIVKGVIDKAAATNGKAVESAAKPLESPVAADPNAGKEKYVVDGKEIFLTPEQARSYVQKGISFEPKMDQLGRMQHETAAFLQTLKDDPARIIYNESFGKPQEVLAKLLNSTKVSDEIKETLGQWYYDHVIVPSKMSPQELEAQEWKRKAIAHDELISQREQERLEAENNSRIAGARQIITAQISEAMKEAGVPIDSKIAPQLAQRVARVMHLGFLQNKAITPKEAMAIVKADILETQKSYYDILDEDKLVEQLGKENAEKVRKYYLKAVKESEKKPKDFKPGAKRDERKVMTPDEFHEYLQDLKKK